VQQSRWQTQNEFLLDVAKELYECIPLLPQDFIRIAELNAQYADLPGDFADLSLVAISERLEVVAIATLEAISTSTGAIATSHLSEYLDRDNFRLMERAGFGRW
jgi:hypothetical protein